MDSNYIFNYFNLTIIIPIIVCASIIDLPDIIKHYINRSSKPSLKRGIIIYYLYNYNHVGYYNKDTIIKINL